MDIQSQHWVALDPSATEHSDSHQFVRSFNDGGKTGIFAAISEPVPAELRRLAPNPHYYQQTEKGAVFALEAAQQALTDLIEQQLEFDISFLDLLAKHWQTRISKHFASLAADTDEQKDGDSPQNNLSQLASIYDATISIVRMTEQQLMIYQIGYARLLFLNEQHQIDIRSAKMNVKSSSLQFLADPNLKTTFPCQTIGVHEYGLEMLMLLPEHYALTKTKQQLHDEAYQLSHLLDVKGRAHVSTYLHGDKEEAGRIVIKRNRRWYDGLSSALDRDTYFLNNKLEKQEQQIGQLKSEIKQLTQITKKLTSSSVPPSLPESTSDTDTDTTKELPYRPLYIENLPYQGEEKVHDKSRSGALLFSTLFLLLGLTGAYYLWQGQQVKLGKPDNVISSLVKEDKQSRNKDKFVEAIKGSAGNSEETGEGSATKKVSMTLLPEKDKNQSNTSSTATGRQKKTLSSKQSETDVMVTKLIMHSTEFAGKVLQVNKKTKEIKAMDELFEMTKNKHYSHQKKILIDKKDKLDKNIQTLSEQYSTLLKHLCSNDPVQLPSMSKRASPLERIAFEQLEKQLTDCSKPKEITAAHIGEVLRSQYKQLSTQN